MFLIFFLIIEDILLRNKTAVIYRFHHDWLFSHLDVHAIRPHKGQNMVAERLRALLNTESQPSKIAGK